MGAARRRRLRRLLAGQRADRRHAGAVARAAVRRDLRLSRCGCAPRIAGSRKGGVAHDGEVATRLGLPGIPAFAETIALGTLLELVRATGARVHVCRLSTAGAVRDDARGEEGRPAGHLRRRHPPRAPLRRRSRLLRLATAASSRRCAASATATRCARRSPTARSTALCSDHTPVDEDGKQLPFAEAEPGATGLELLLPLTLKWGAARKLRSPADAGAHHLRAGAHPRRRLRAHRGRRAGRPRDLRSAGAVAHQRPRR